MATAIDEIRHLPPGEAQAALRALIAADPDNVAARVELGRVLLGMGRIGVAADALREAVARAPDNAEGHRLLGRALWHLEKPEPALAAFAEATRIDPADSEAWQLRLEAVAAAPPGLIGPKLAGHLVDCLGRDGLEHRMIARAAAATLGARNGFAALVAADRLDAGDIEGLAADPLLVRLLERAVVRDIHFERLTTRIRRTLLGLAGGAALAPGLGALACATAQQCRLAGFVHDETEDETVAVEALQRALAEAEPGVAWPAAAVLAAYRPLDRTPLADALAGPGWRGLDPAFDRLLARHVLEPAEERRIAPQIPALGRIDDSTSRVVRAQYEESPYPCWTETPSRRAAPAASILADLLPAFARDPSPIPAAPEILIAGCGTGREAFYVKARYAGARVTAVDLSLASLAYAERRRRELGVEGITFAQADLLGLGETGLRFDMVFSSGVLHHLRRPLDGWRVLRGLLRPGGLMRIGLYSRRARAPILEAQAFARRRGFPATPEGIRAFRRAVLTAPGILLKGILQFGDFYTAPECRDLCLHVMEHDFTLAEIGRALAALDLELLGFELRDPALLAAYRRETPDDPEARSLAGWDAFERRHPNAFRGMYQFWLRAVDPAPLRPRSPGPRAGRQPGRASHRGRSGRAS